MVFKKSIIIYSLPDAVVIDKFVKTKCGSYKDVSSQTAQQTIKKVEKSYKSFFESIKNPKLNAQLPKYLTNNHFNVIFQRQSFQQLKKSIRLSLGKKSKKDENSLNYLYIKTGHLPGKVIEAELVPSTNAIFYHLILKYEIEPTHVNQEKSGSIKDYASIDLGITNLATMYIPYKRPYIIDGSEIKSVNYETKRKNAKNQKNKVGKSKRDHTWLEREQKIKNYLHVASSRVIELLKLNKTKHLIIGYNKGWKLKCNMGKQNNETFYKVWDPENDQDEEGDALNNETVGYHKSYSGKRTRRGIFQSNSGICINSDVNGAINILRKYVYRKINNLVDDLHKCIQSSKSQIHNSVKSGIVKGFLSRKGKSYIDLVLWS